MQLTWTATFFAIALAGVYVAAIRTAVDGPKVLS